MAGIGARQAVISSLFKRGVNLTGKGRVAFPNSALVNFISSDVSRIDACAQWFVSNCFCEIGKMTSCVDGPVFRILARYMDFTHSSHCLLDYLAYGTRSLGTCWILALPSHYPDPRASHGLPVQSSSEVIGMD